MAIEKVYQETWTCDSCGQQALFTDPDHGHPKGWASFRFSYSMGNCFNHKYHLCSDCVSKWVTEANKLLARFVLDEQQQAALEAGVPIIDLLGDEDNDQ